MEGRGTLFHRQADILKSDYHVHVVQYDSAAPQTFDRFSNQALQFAQRFSRLNPGAPGGILCGFSLGACTAIECVIREPNLFSALVLINPATAFARTGLAGPASWVMRHLPSELIRIGSDLTLPLNANLSRFHDEELHLLKKVSRSVPQNDISRRLESLSRFDASENRLRKITVPVLLIAAENDHVQPSLAEVNRLFQVWPHSKRVILHGSGHECLQEDQFDLLTELRQFLSAVSVV
ncbi:MAG: alpha/beta fold hydrolase [Leptospirales bacterium]|nr:alpha/beta fold hydrolase [Leptospirales bacterium]